MDTPVRETARRNRAEEWALVLAAAGIDCRVRVRGHRFTLLVAAEDSARARAALDAYDDEARRSPPPAAPAPPAALPWEVGLLAAVALLAFFAITGPPASGSRWFAAGAASAGAIANGEAWRAVTALTLHADALHVAGNAVAVAVLVPAVAQRFGAGLGLALVLLAGVLGNVASALAHDPRHIAVGASTAVFGAIGILAAARMLAVRATGRKPWVIPVATLVLLALLGAGRGADVVAHALGLLAGGAVGLCAALVPGRPGPAVQWALLAVVVLAIAGCWRLALAAASG